VWGWDFFEPARFAVTVVITYLLMALMIVLGILFPARKAMKTEPAIALKDE
jgi:putative ABC transport system permease protein